MIFVFQLYLRYILVGWHSGWSECVNIHEGNLKMEFLHQHGAIKTFSWPSVADKCFVSASNILCTITAPTTITGRMYRISHTDFEPTLKAYENHKIQLGIWKAVVHIWSLFSLGINSLFFFSNFLATRKNLLSVKLELKISLPLRLIFKSCKWKFWIYHTRKRTHTKFQDERTTRTMVITENINSNWRILPKNTHFGQIFKSQ